MRQVYNIPSRAYDPPPLAPISSSPSLVLPAVPSPAVMDSTSCMISDKCRKDAKRDSPADADGREELNCETLVLQPGYFRCLCAKTKVMGHNEYFSAHCVLQECTDDQKRRAFLRQYQEGCRQIGSSLTDIPDEWGPYADNLALFSSAVASSTAQQTATTSTTPSQSTSSSAQPDQTRSLTSKTAMDKPTSTQPDTGETTSSLADIQIPICGITPQCMTEKPKGEPSCTPSDLDCICKTSHSLEKNTEFNQQCVLDTCYGDIGREEFLDNLIYHCKKVGYTLTDIPKRWEPYLPSSFPTTTSPGAPVLTSPSPPSPSPAASKNSFGPSAIAGTVVAATAVLTILLCLAKLYWNTRKKASRLRVENAQLHDATNPEGVSRRITALMSGTYTPSIASARPADDHAVQVTSQTDAYGLEEIPPYHGVAGETEDATTTVQEPVYDDSESDYGSLRSRAYAEHVSVHVRPLQIGHRQREARAGAGGWI